MRDTIQKLAASYHEDLIKMRRHLHQHPELSFQEKKTGKYIATQLKKMGIKHQHGCAENGVVAIIKGQKNNKNQTDFSTRRRTTSRRCFYYDQGRST